MAAIARLKKRADFLSVAATKRRWVAPGLILQAAIRSAEAEAAVIRIGFTATRKIGIAVARNRARRRLRAAAAQVLPRHAALGHDYVLVARAETLVRPFAALVGDLETALRRLKAYREAAVAAAGEG